MITEQSSTNLVLMYKVVLRVVYVNYLLTFLINGALSGAVYVNCLLTLCDEWSFVQCSV